MKATQKLEANWGFRLRNLSVSQSLQNVSLYIEELIIINNTAVVFNL